QVVANPETGQLVLPNRFTPPEQITIRQFHYGQEPRVQAPIPEGAIPLMPRIVHMHRNEANHFLVESGYKHIQYINEPYGEVPPQHTHRQDPLWDQPVETIRKIRVWVNP
ncbi:MAG: hypothetical protein ACQEP5_08995, partial [Actinomycetota bacterium]